MSEAKALPPFGRALLHSISGPGPRRAALISAGFFLLAFLLYLKSLSPAFHPDDSPETITAGATLSIQHPPGYPLHSLLGRLAVLSLPGSPAFRINLLSALFGALSLLLFAWVAAFADSLARGTARRLEIVLPAAALLACTKELWFQSAIAKGGIYTLNLALTLATVLALLRFRALWNSEGEEGAWPNLALAGLFFGLGFANHWTSQVVLLPAYALLLFEAWWAKGRPVLKPLALRLLAPAAFVLPGISLYLYLPLRTLWHPLLQWGEPTTLKGFWWLFNRSQYASIESGKSFKVFATLLSRVGSNLQAEFHVLGLLALALGWAALFWKNWKLALGLFLAPLTLVLAVCLKANPPADSLWIIDPYLVPLYAFAALGFIGLPLFFPKIERPLLASLGAGALALFFWHRALGDQSGHFLAWDYVNNLLLSAPKNAVVFCEGDSNTAGPFYHCYVAGKRKDLSLVVTVLSDYEWYREGLAHHNPGLKVPPHPMTPPGNILWMAKANAPRPTVLTNTYTKEWADAKLMAPRGLMNLWLGRPATGTDVERNRVWAAYAFRGAFDYALATDALTQRLVQDNYVETLARLAEGLLKFGKLKESEAEYAHAGEFRPKWAAPWVQAGNMAWQRKELARAGELWQRAEKEEPESVEAAANLGLYFLNIGDYPKALQRAEAALRLKPDFANALQLRQQALEKLNRPAPVSNGSAEAALGDKLAGQGQNQEALEAYDKALKLGYRNAGVHRNRAVLFARLGKNQQSVKELEKAVQIEPANAELWKFLGVFRFNLADFKGALSDFEKSLSLNPADSEVQSFVAQSKAKLGVAP